MNPKSEISEKFLMKKVELSCIIPYVAILLLCKERKTAADADLMFGHFCGKSLGNEDLYEKIVGSDH